MQAHIGTRAPVHLWVVAVLATLWNGFGCYDYWMTRSENADYIRSMMPGADPSALFAWIDGFPLWAEAAYGLGPWSALAGSILLLLRSRFAVHAFALSLIGMAGSFAYTYLMAPPMPGAPEGPAAYIPLLIVIVGVALLWYAMRQAKRNVLR